MKKRALSPKEKKEIILILSSVLVVAIVGVSLTALQPTVNLAGQAVHFDSSRPTYEGSFILLQQYCQPQSGSGSCTEICYQKSCLPLEESCNVELEQNNCICCEVPN